VGMRGVKKGKKSLRELETEKCGTIFILMQGDRKPEAFCVEHELSKILDEVEGEGLIEGWKSTTRDDEEQLEDSLLEEVVKRAREYHLRRAKREELILCLLKKGDKDVVEKIRKKWRSLRIVEGENG